jgi:hypothetical protein
MSVPDPNFQQRGELRKTEQPIASAIGRVRDYSMSVYGAVYSKETSNVSHGLNYKQTGDESSNQMPPRSIRFERPRSGVGEATNLKSIRASQPSREPRLGPHAFSRSSQCPIAQHPSGKQRRFQ